MKLKSLDKYNDIVIQMHDNPDADAVGSGYALYKYLKFKGKNPELVYSGRYKITKSNILLLIKELEIPVKYVKELNNPELLLMVDCQYGEGNVTKFEAQNIAMIDHHNTGRISDEMCEIRSHIVSCSTICYDMIKKEGFNFNDDIGVATALYYGLYMDSNSFSEIRHPIERDMIDYLKIDNVLLRKLFNANFTLQELETAGIAMLRYSYDESKRMTIIKSKPCDSNILGVIGDFMLQVDTVDVSIIYNECFEGYKLSVRSCIPEITANDMADFLTKGIGNGGGHDDKAGGIISIHKYNDKYGNLNIDTYFFDKIREYYESFDIVYAKNGIEDKSDFKLYKRDKIIRGYVRTTDILEAGVEFRIRTLEGDVYIVAEDNAYVIIGSEGEVCSITKERFEEEFETMRDKFECVCEYEPIITEMNNNRNFNLLNYAFKCVSKQNEKVYAKQLEKSAKVFTKWDYSKYVTGAIGDYICYDKNDNKNIYVIKKDEFDKSYEPVIVN